MSCLTKNQRITTQQTGPAPYNTAIGFSRSSGLSRGTGWALPAKGRGIAGDIFVYLKYIQQKGVVALPASQQRSHPPQRPSGERSSIARRL
jgi:hypothetical protein